MDEDEDIIACTGEAADSPEEVGSPPAPEDEVQDNIEEQA